MRIVGSNLDGSPQSGKQSSTGLVQAEERLAQMLLNWMNEGQNLLQPSCRNASNGGKELLRPAEGGVDSEPESLLLASNKPEIELTPHFKATFLEAILQEVVFLLTTIE